MAFDISKTRDLQPMRLVRFIGWLIHPKWFRPWSIHSKRFKPNCLFGGSRFRLAWWLSGTIVERVGKEFHIKLGNR